MSAEEHQGVSSTCLSSEESRLLVPGAVSSSADEPLDPRASSKVSCQKLEGRLDDTSQWSTKQGDNTAVRFANEAPRSPSKPSTPTSPAPASTSSPDTNRAQSLLSIPSVVTCSIPSMVIPVRVSGVSQLSTGSDSLPSQTSQRSKQSQDLRLDVPASPCGQNRASTVKRISQYPGRPSYVEDPTARKNLVQRIQANTYYRGETAAKLRSCVHAKFFLLVMTIALFIALLLPEVWVLSGVNSNTVVDVVLTLVMVLFAIEFTLLTVLDATYLFSFFFFMDIIGTISMIFDISFMVGMDHTKIQTFNPNESGSKRNLMLLRATRAARVGARAGRLSRVLRILRFLPFLSNKKNEIGGGVAATISRRLANLLATRVACLTIILVVVIPIFDILNFPQMDHSLQTWVERLSWDLRERTTLGNATFAAEMMTMVTFFEKRSYGPYMACSGKAYEDFFDCQEYFTAAWAIEAPGRGASALWVHTDEFMVGFNMHNTHMLDKGLAILQICFIIGIMIFSGLALSNVVTELAVRPLERMLKTVRSIAEQVFKMSTGLLQPDDEEEQEEFDINTSTEMKLLEKVVTKLSVIAGLHSGAPMKVEEDMGEEDVGILNMMQGKDVVQDGKKQAQRRVSKLIKQKDLLQFGDKSLIAGSQFDRKLVHLADAGVAVDLFNSYGFNTLALNKPQQATVGVYIISRFFDDGDGFIHTQREQTTLETFVHAVEKEYLTNPFHNFSHATDVLHGVARMMRMVQSENFLTELEHFSLLIAAIGHDIGHPGVNNGFLSEVGHELALQYNDLSPLENMHVSKLYGILVNQETNVFANLSKEQYKEARRYCIETILHTDMMGHQAMVKELQLFFHVNSEIFTNGVMGEAQIEVFSSPETKMLVMDNFLHSADVSNPCRTWEVSQAWAMCVLEEFFSQGDQERMLGVPVQYLNERTLNRPNSQIGFLEFMIAPFFAAQIKIFNTLHEYGDNLAQNLVMWESMWVVEVAPDEEARLKVRARVEKVKANLEEANQTSAPLALSSTGTTPSPERKGMRSSAVHP